MLPSFLITFREVIEATLIVATILGILVKLNQHKNIKTVWMATFSAGIVSMGLLLAGSIAGLKIQELYSGAIEQTIEGILMIISAIFITSAVFWLHRYFAHHKVHLLQKVKKTIENKEQKGLFILVFTAVFREGFEIVLFLSTVYLSSNPQQVMSGFGLGLIAALFVSALFFTATLRMPVFYAFRTTSVLLVLFAAGLVGRGVHEFTEAGMLPELTQITLSFIPHSKTFMGGIIKGIFGISQSMDTLQIVSYAGYIGFMSFWLFGKRNSAPDIQ